MMQRVLILLLALTALGWLAADELRQRWEAPLSIPQKGFVIAISKGESLKTVADSLHDSGILRHPRLLTLYGRWTGFDQQIKQGEYWLQPGLTAEKMLNRFRDGDVISYQVTLPEGITLAKALEILSLEPNLEATLEGASDERLIELVHPYAHPEGLFFPDSYHYVLGDSDWNILQRAHRAMIETLEEEWENKASPLPYENAYEALIMASIIERETGLVQERTQISGVFVRRLQQGMLLQTDPTIIYGMGEAFEGNLRRSDLREESNMYNTYRHAGLPPTPIALPGRAAIHAALHPDEGTAMYFVARGDGGHVFSTTLAEHNRAVAQYQLRRKKNYRSSPQESQQDE